VNTIAVSSIVFASIFAAALIGMTIRRALPPDHVGSDVKEVVRLATGLVVTMSALVLGMLVSTSKSSYDARKNEVMEMSVEIVNIDRLLAKYGPETGEIRAELRQLVEAGLDRVWPSERSHHSELRPGDHGEILFEHLSLLAPKNGEQTSAKAEATSMITSLRRTQWLMFLKLEQSAVPLPLLAVLVSWLATVFVSFGLFAPPNATVVVTLALGALAVSSAIFIILEMYTPFSGILRISPAPILEALIQLGH
jgi:hypothetical protein